MTASGLVTSGAGPGRAGGCRSGRAWSSEEAGRPLTGEGASLRPERPAPSGLLAAEGLQGQQHPLMLFPGSCQLDRQPHKHKAGSSACGQGQGSARVCVMLGAGDTGWNEPSFPTVKAGEVGGQRACVQGGVCGALVALGGVENGQS